MAQAPAGMPHLNLPAAVIDAPEGTCYNPAGSTHIWLDPPDRTREREMTKQQRSALWTGLGFIGLGVALILAQFIGWDRIWPLFPLLGGLAFLVGYVASGFRESGFVFVGVLATLLGIFFFGFSLGFWEWGDMRRLWSVFPLIAGIAFVALFVAERARDTGPLAVGCAAVIVGIVGLAVTYGYVGARIWKLWPLLLVLAGIIGLVGAFLQFLRRD